MLAFNVNPDGGVYIGGSKEDLCNLIGWVAIAIKEGESGPVYVADKSLTQVRIICRPFAKEEA
jgi:hypothetical protein